MSARGTVGGGGWGRLNQLGGNTMWLKQLETYYEFEASSNANKGEPRQNGASSPGHHSSCDVSINTYTFVERWSLGMLSLKILNSTYLADWAHIGWNQNNVKLFWKALSVFQSDLLYLQLVSLLRRMGGVSFPLKGYFLWSGLLAAVLASVQTTYLHLVIPRHSEQQARYPIIWYCKTSLTDLAQRPPN